MFGMSKERTGRVLSVPIGKIKADSRQPRRVFDQEQLLGLAQSIRQNGILQPLSVRPTEEGDYLLIAGERRLRAALIAGLTHVPCLEVDVDDSQSAIFSLIENLQRQDLCFFDEASAIADLIERFGMSQEQVAAKLGKNQSTISNKLRLLHIAPADRETIIKNGLSERHARALLRIGDGERAEVIRQIIARDLTVKETERLIEAMLFEPKKKEQSRSLPVIKDVRIFLNTVDNAVNIMKKSGIDAVAVKQEYEGYFEYTVRIPKNITSKSQIA